MRSSGSSRGESRSRPHSSAAYPSSRSSASPTAPCQEAKQRVRSGIASAELEFPVPAHHRQPRARRVAQGGLRLRPAHRARYPCCVAAAAARRARRARRLRRARARRPPAAVPAARSSLRKRATTRAIDRLLCAATLLPKSRSPASSPCRSRHLAEAVAYLRGETSRRRADVAGGTPAAQPRPISPTCAATSAHGGRSRSPPPGGTTCCSPGRRERGRRCSRGGCRRPAAARRRRGAGGDAYPLGRRACSRRAAADRAAAVPRAAPFSASMRGDRRRGRRPAAGRGQACAPRRAAARRAARSSSARRSKRCGSRSRTASSPSHALPARRSFPARFQLIATMNLCPCGARGDPATSARARRSGIAPFRDKLSRALLDRFDLVVTVPRPRGDELAGRAGEPSEAVRGARRRRARASRGRRRDARRRRRVAHARGRTAAALGPRPGTRRAGGGDDRGARRRGRGRARARRGGALVPTAAGADR